MTAARDKRKIQIMKNQADWLLHIIIPKHFAEQLKNTSKYSENHKNADIMFASIVNFHEMYDESFEGGKEYPHALNELASTGAAGYDIFCVKGFEIKPNEQKAIFTDLALEMPNNCYARIAPKSSLSLNNIMINAGVIDGDYRGNIGVLMHNFGLKIIIFEPGSVIAQIIFEQIMHPSFIEKTFIKHH
ncbi:deoxyuridine 5'-triphosphate nucleotidohydrolase, mitochondrial-like [Centruroides sculpturatus]|uniref:deoxyuridine 5'-triphosphate nucleotidohydrolase, mitochondrial-like n=1 Tax=Centruroides sculpturatus TaxID=218467 RepID=UPI000C6D72E2|nr:deoxyuridine 5'-triphosphate nucleotidohydrolase, mitochondrial-like [Centruroides sculpturatus]